MRWTTPPGLGLLALAAVLYSRAGYGLLGDREPRRRPCTASHCPHVAGLVAALALVALAHGR